MDGAVLDQAWALGANLAGASLVKASLFATQLAGANLDGANLAGARITADMNRARLVGARLEKADCGADLKNQSMGLMRASFKSADLTGADFARANLTLADLQFAKMTAANFAGATLREADASGADLRGARLEGADTSGLDVEFRAHRQRERAFSRQGDPPRSRLPRVNPSRIRIRTSATEVGLKVRWSTAGGERGEPLYRLDSFSSVRKARASGESLLSVR